MDAKLWKELEFHPYGGFVSQKTIFHQSWPSLEHR